MNSQENTALTTCGLFRGIPEPEILRLLRCLCVEETKLEKGEILWHAGDSVHACALILSGALRAEAINDAGEKTVVAYHAPGALVGDVLMSTPGSISPVFVIAAERTTLLHLPYRSIMGGCSCCCPRHTRLRENLLSEIAGKYWEQRRRAAYLSAPSLRRRITMYLSDRAAFCGSREFTLEGTREDLADLLGVNRTALCRELSRMKREGLLDFHLRTFHLP